MRRFLLIPIALLVACKGGESEGSDSDDDDRQPATPVAQASFDAGSITPSMVALGDSIFHGKIGASSCQACHGVGGKAGAAAPDLTDTEWLHSDGSWQNIYSTIKSGVMAPKQFSSVMPPYGGVMLSEERTRAVAAYVYSISHAK